MKGIEEQTYYEILEVSPTATVKEIQKAYEHARETFHADSLAVYSLFTEQEIREIQTAIEEAYRVLMDEALRKSYDRSHDQASGSPNRERLPELRPISQEKRDFPSSTEVSVGASEVAYRGRTLKQIREKTGIDLEIISKETKISRKTLEAIEEENFEKLPPLVYLKGFLREYAKSLSLDPQKVVEGYLRFSNEAERKSSP